MSVVGTEKVLIRENSTFFRGQNSSFVLTPLYLTRKYHDHAFSKHLAVREIIMESLTEHQTNLLYAYSTVHRRIFLLSSLSKQKFKHFSKPTAPHFVILCA